MQAVLQWVLAAGAALLAIAVAVASWEQLRGEPAPEPSPEPAAPPRPTGVDIELDPALALRSGSANDRQARSRALDSALDRMAQPRPRNPAGWTDTEPMVGPGPRAEAPGTSAQPRSTATH